MLDNGLLAAWNREKLLLWMNRVWRIVKWIHPSPSSGGYGSESSNSTSVSFPSFLRFILFFTKNWLSRILELWWIGYLQGLTTICCRNYPKKKWPAGMSLPLQCRKLKTPTSKSPYAFLLGSRSRKRLKMRILIRIQDLQLQAGYMTRECSSRIAARTDSKFLTIPCGSTCEVCP